MGYLNIPDLPTSVTITNTSGRFLRLSASGSPGLPDLAIGETVTISLVNMWEARRLRRFNSIIAAMNASLISVAGFNENWGTLKVTNLTDVIQQLGNLMPFAASEVRQVSLINTSVSRRIRIWRWLNNVNAGSTFSFDITSETPDVDSIAPASLDLAGGAVTITGTNFQAGATVTIGGTAATSVVVVSSTEITCVAPIKTAGAKDVVVTNADGESGILPGGFTYTAITFGSITPNTGTHTGGTPVTIVGTNFVSGTTVTIGGAPITSKVFVSSTEITGVTPAGTDGSANVVVTNPGSGGSTATGTGAFTYT
jgi:IPT/TIG domain